MKKRIIDVYGAKYRDNYIIPSWQEIADSYTKSTRADNTDGYGENLNKRGYSSKYGIFYNFCLECANIENCKVGKILKNAPLHKITSQSLKDYQQGIIKGRNNQAKGRWITKIIEIQKAQRKARAIFLDCRHRITALRIIKKAKEKAHQ